MFAESDVSYTLCCKQSTVINMRRDEHHQIHDIIVSPILTFLCNNSITLGVCIIDYISIDSERATCSMEKALFPLHSSRNPMDVETLRFVVFLSIYTIIF